MKIPRARVGLATPKSDAVLRERERKKGLEAKLAGKPRSNCPWSRDSMMGIWWLEGYDSV